MKILSLELKGAVRLELGGIKKITINPQTGIMAILGPNSSGKSSLLELLSPLPAEKNDFEKNGYKKISLEHNGTKYTLSSDFSRDNIHSFINDDTGEELNVGGTITYQKQLVKDYFNYTPQIHALLLGQERFTSMSPTKRKEWFTTLCDSDYTYAISVFNKAKEKHRDAQGALKKAKQHQLQLMYGQENQSDDLDAINLNIQEREKRIEELQNILPSSEYRHPEVYNQLQNSYTNLMNQTTEAKDELIRYTKAMALYGITDESIPELKEKQERLTQQYNYILGQYKSRVNQYTQLENKISRMNVSNDSEVNEWIRLRDENQNKIDLLIQEGNRNGELNHEEAINHYQQWLQAQGDILEVIRSLSDIQGDKVLQQHLDDTHQELNQLTHEINKIRQELSRLEEAHSIMDRANEREKVMCPNCTHEFHPGFNQERFLKIKEALSSRNQLLLSKEKERQDKENELAIISKNNGILKNLVNIAKHTNGLLNNIVKKTLAEQLYLTSPIEVEHHLLDYVDCIQKHHEASMLIQSNQSLNERIQSASMVNKKYYEESLAELEALSKEVEEYNRDKLFKETQLRETTRLITIYDSFKELQVLLEERLDATEEVEKRIAEKLLYDEITALISDEKIQVGILAKKQVEILASKTTMDNLNKQIADLEREVSSWATVIDCMNPQDGLIAEGLLGYIKIFISKMNRFIQRIWTYPLTIKPTKQNDDETSELSYRFPINVGLSKRDRPDVQNGSDGVKEVIDLAFKMMAMQSLGLANYPIYLDEFGRTFDEAHRENALRLIDKISEEHIENQIFMVSHLYTQYSAIEQSIFYCVLSEENIVLPSKNVNTHVTIER